MVCSTLLQSAVVARNKIHQTPKNMTSRFAPITAKLGRLAIENVNHTSRSLFLRQSNHLTSTKKNLCTATDKSSANPTNPGVGIVSETEQKLKSEIEQKNQEIDKLKEENGELLNKYKRALADSENLRIRLSRQIDEAKIYGIQGFCKDLLDVADILGKATESVPKDEISERNPHLKNLYEGLTMTETQLHKVFKKHGLVSVNPLSEKFNPQQHEALFEQEVQGKEPGTVVVVSKVGYKLHERIIRPALVGVSKG